MTLVGMVAGESFGFMLSTERLLTVRANKIRSKAAVNQVYLLAQARVERAKTELRDALKQETREARNGGCGKVCRALKTQTVEARQRLAFAEAALTKLPVPNTMNHIAKVTGIPAIVVDVVPALAFSTALLLLGFCFIGFAHGSGKQVKVTTDLKRQPLRPSRPLPREDAVADLLEILDLGDQIPEQRILAARWGVTPGCVSKWLGDLEARGVIRRERDGKAKAVSAA